MSVSTKELLAFGVPYVVAVGAAYTLGYWGAFGLNPLEFIGLNELGRLAVYPLLATLALGVLAMVGTHLLSVQVLPPGGGANTAIGRAGRKQWRLLLAAVTAAAVATVLFAPEPYKWPLLAMLLSSFSTPLSHVPRVIELLPNPHFRAIVLLLFVALPPLSFSQGRVKAYLLVHQGPSFQVDLQRSALPAPPSAASQPAYLGYIGGMHVLRESPTGVLVLVKQKENAPLYLVPTTR